MAVTKTGGTNKSQNNTTNNTNSNTVGTVSNTNQKSSLLDTKINKTNTSGGSINTVSAIPSFGEATVIDVAKEISLQDTISESTPNESVIPQFNKNGKDILQQNPYSYPRELGGNGDPNIDKFKYLYEINMQQNLLDAIQNIKENLNIPSAYSRLDLNKLFHEKFNRFRIQYPDYFLNGTIGYVVMTRPDLNLFKSDSDLSINNIVDEIKNDPQMYYIMNADIETARTLVKGYSTQHHFNPLLSNTLTSLDISDESIDTLETGETFTGFKTQYAKSNIKSMTAGTISLKFPETYNMAITHAHQLWCTYESCVYRGSLEPKFKYIWKKELDYACDIYYFLLDKQDMIIRYWCKYTGCFPLNVNKSVFSYDVGSELNHPEMSVTYAYFVREDMSAITLHEFNNNSGGRNIGFKYRANYTPKLDAQGCTWSGPPFVEPIKQKTGMNRDATLYALRFRE